MDNTNNTQHTPNEIDTVEKKEEKITKDRVGTETEIPSDGNSKSPEKYYWAAHFSTILKLNDKYELIECLYQDGIHDNFYDKFIGKIVKTHNFDETNRNNDYLTLYDSIDDLYFDNHEICTFHKITKTIVKNKNGKITERYRKEYLNGLLNGLYCDESSRGTYVNGKKNGEWIINDEWNGQKRTIFVNFSNGELHGKYLLVIGSFYAGGLYNNGYKIGKWNYFGQCLLKTSDGVMETEKYEYNYDNDSFGFNGKTYKSIHPPSENTHHIPMKHEFNLK